MSYKAVYNALYDQLSTDSTLIGYVQSACFIKGFKENLPQQEYMLVLEPVDDGEDERSQAYNRTKEIEYLIEIYCRTILFGIGVEGSIIGHSATSKKGVLEFLHDVRAAIRSDLTLGYNRNGSSVSAENSGTSFNLTSSNRYITVSINGNTPSGYDAIDCGSTTLTGAEVASNIQTALQALGSHTDDGYWDATCTFSNSTKKFTITSQRYGPKSTVVVTAGASNDCSALLGFDNSTEVAGRNIVKITLGRARTDNTLYPVRYRILPVTIKEEIIV